MRAPKSIVRILLFPLPILLAIGLVLFGRQALDSASASHGATQGWVDFVSIDMDPTLTPRNGGAEFGTSQCGDDGGGDPSTGDSVDQDADTVADDGCPGGVNAYVTTVGTIEPCIQKALNTNYTVDITADQVHPSDDLEGWQFDLNFDPTKEQVIAVSDSNGLTFMGADLAGVTSFSSSPNADVAADADLINEGIDGSITLAAVDFGDSTAQQGEGILARVTLRDIAQGVSDLTLTKLKLNPVGPQATGQGDTLLVQTIQNATAAGGVACSAGTATPTVPATPTPSATMTPSIAPTVTPTQTPTPSSSSSPSPGSSLTPTPTPTSAPSPTLSPSSTPTPTPSPTPVGQTPTPGAQLAWGNVDCQGDADSVDALQDIRFVARLSVSQAPLCPPIGDVVEVVGASPHMWGDVDCSGGVDSLDALRILRHVARLPNPDIVGCPRMGEPYEVR